MYPSDSVASLARCISSGSRGLLLGSGNEGLGWKSIDELVEQGVPFAVEVRDGVFAVDCDLDHNGFQRELHFAALLRGFESARVPFVVAASGRPGHRHLLARLNTGPDYDGLVDWTRAGGLDVRKTIRPPLSPHRSGLPVALLPPVSQEDESQPYERQGIGTHVIGCNSEHSGNQRVSTNVGIYRQVALAVQALSCPHDPGRILRAVGSNGLSRRMGRVVQEGHQAGGYASASEARMGLTVAARARGLSPAYIGRLLTNPANAIGSTFRERPASWQQHELSRMWEKAGVYLSVGRNTATPEGNLPLTGEMYLLALRSVTWRGMAGSTDLALAEGIGRRSSGSCAQRVLLPLTEAAVLAGVSLATARRSLRRLCAGGWLRLVEAPSPTHASVFALSLPPGVSRPEATTTDDKHADVNSEAVPTDDSIQDLGSDVARWGALGKSATRVLRELLPGPATAPDLARQLGVSVSTIMSHLRRLAACGAVVRAGRMWRFSALAEKTSGDSLV